MSLHRQLQQREAAKKPIRIALTRTVKKGQSLSWSDVAIDTMTAAYRVRREMVSLFAVPILKTA